ncbi:MAG TPA: MXAN_6640 family putative metalloprotease [Nocardioidaceae bacterium]|nr:MXAN_6640 family putative metalloprotease [Nocardioidaceae bacterium]
MRARTTLLGLLSVLLAVAGPTGIAAADAPAHPPAGSSASAAAPGASQSSSGEKVLPAPLPSSGKLGQALAAGRISPATYALRRAKRLLDGPPVRDNARVLPAARRDATLVLRDLGLRLDALSPKDQAQAERLLARPTDGAKDPIGQGYQTKDATAYCLAKLCVHWVATTTDAPAPQDSDGDKVPDWVELTGATFEHVWDTEVGEYGYRAPKSDLTSQHHGPDGKLDVYLADLGDDRLYGYCTSDDPARRSRWDVSAYCVVDDDFAAAQYGGVAPVTSLRVTAAHEFFHAIQFGYDWAEDVWLMEGTAAWVEDEVYDGANDNLQYLRASPLVQPTEPLDFPGDLSNGADARRYGSWIFWRFLTEYFGSSSRHGAGTPDASVIRDIWRKADARPSAPDQYSLQAVRTVTARRGVGFGPVFADFAAVNRVAKRWYDEGRSYPQAHAARTFRLTRKRQQTAQWSASLNHLASVHAAFRARPSLTGRRRLRITLDLPNTVRGSRATVTVHRRNGSMRMVDARLNRFGNGTVTVPFTRRSVGSVALTLTNASTRYRCFRGTVLACGGLPRDDGLTFSFRAHVLR